MKWLAFLFLTLNVAAWAYFNQEKWAGATVTQTQADIMPEKIVLLSPQQIALQPKKTTLASSPVPRPVVSTELTTAKMCYEWGPFVLPNLEKAKAAIRPLNLNASVKEQTLQEARRFWVYKSPLPSDEAAQEKVTELRALGISELYIVQDPKWKNAISFGVFSDEKLATALLEELKAKGVRDIIKAVRNQGRGHASLEFDQLTEDNLQALKNLKSEFPDAALSERTCS